MEKVKDTIYRQDAIDALHYEIVRRRVDEDTNDDGALDEFDTEAILRQLPSAQPERKTGKWIYITDGHYEYFKCDQCEKHSGEPTPFCRYCGADMREGQDG